jgi:hypothetical protein
MDPKLLHTIAGWHILGNSRADILEMLTAEGITDPGAHLDAALEQIEKLAGTSDQNTAWHLAARRELYK